MELEKKVLAGIMEFLDGQEGEKLKKHPKLIALEAMKSPQVEKLEDPKEEASESPSEEMSEDDLSPEMIQKILEMYKQSK